LKAADHWRRVWRLAVRRETRKRNWIPDYLSDQWFDRHEDPERCQDRSGNHERHAVLCRHAVSSPHTLIDYLEGGGSLAASLEQKKEEGNGRLARWGRKSRAGRPCPS
jgi:hypothetical protein